VRIISPMYLWCHSRSGFGMALAGLQVVDEQDHEPVGFARLWLREIASTILLTVIMPVVAAFGAASILVLHVVQSILRWSERLLIDRICATHLVFETELDRGKEPRVSAADKVRIALRCSFFIGLLLSGYQYGQGKGSFPLIFFPFPWAPDMPWRAFVCSGHVVNYVRQELHW
jgi:hypothetical protein